MQNLKPPALDVPADLERILRSARGPGKSRAAAIVREAVRTSVAPSRDELDAFLGGCATPSEWHAFAQLRRSSRP